MSYRLKFWVASGVVALATTSVPAMAQSGKPNVDQVVAGLGGQVLRGIDSDICFPATSDEYVGMGKNAILMLESRTAVGTELPLRAVYVMHKGVRIPLQRIVVLPIDENAATGRTTQVSFYLLPIYLMKVNSVLMADFAGDRRGFSVMQFSGIDSGAPSFVRLDEYDAPTEPDMAVVQDVLVREYPDYIH